MQVHYNDGWSSTGDFILVKGEVSPFESWIAEFHGREGLRET